MPTVHRMVMWVFLPLLALAAVLLYGLLRRPEPKRPNVLWITIDSLRADHLGCTGLAKADTPHIDALAREGVLFTQCVSQATYTNMSVPSMLTAKYPYFTGVRTIVPDLDSAHVTLAEVLSPQGYFTCAIPEPWLTGFFQGFQKWQQISQQTRQKTRWCLENLENLEAGRPFFIWLYYWDPHAPYEPPETFMKIYEPDYTDEIQRRYPGPMRRADNEYLKDATGYYSGMVEVLVRMNTGQITPSQAHRDHLIHLYDAEVAYVDSNLGSVLQKVKELGLWDSTLVVLNADHGESFGEHNQFYHGTTLYEQEVRVPLIIKPPGASELGKMVSGAVRNLDIMPTILDYCGIDPPRNIQGVSLRPYIEEDLAADLPTCIETHSLQNQTHLMGYRADGYKLIYNLTQGSGELYHLAQDPQERENLLDDTHQAPDNIPLAQTEDRLRTAFLNTLGVQHLSELKIAETGASMDAQTRERLRALGYIY